MSNGSVTTYGIEEYEKGLKALKVRYCFTEANEAHSVNMHYVILQYGALFYAKALEAARRTTSLKMPFSF